MIASLVLAAALSARPAAEFALKSLDGHTVRLSDFRGKVVLVNFWATWCVGCNVEMPRLVELYRNQRTRGLEIVGVSMDDAGEGVIGSFVKAKHVNFTIVKGDDAVAKAYGGVRFLPQTFVINRNGEIVRSIAGVPDEREFERLIDGLLGSTRN